MKKTAGHGLNYPVQWRGIGRQGNLGIDQDNMAIRLARVTWQGV
jgi:hypothetical protein